MSDAALTPLSPARSLWQDAALRLRRNRAAMTSLVLLGLIGLACLIGPYLTGHPYDRVYPDHVRAPASLQAHPRAETIPAAISASRRGCAWWRPTSSSPAIA